MNSRSFERGGSDRQYLREISLYCQFPQLYDLSFSSRTYVRELVDILAWGKKRRIRYGKYNEDHKVQARESGVSQVHGGP